MNSVSDTVLNGADDKVETAHQEQKEMEATPEVVELGKVSDTRGGWLGTKIDTGAGFTTW
jgi:hypothetical protein